jgi:hypothetical protein
MIMHDRTANGAVIPPPIKNPNFRSTCAASRLFNICVAALSGVYRVSPMNMAMAALVQTPA